MTLTEPRTLREFEYLDFLNTKKPRSHAYGFRVDELNPALFPHARAVTRWAINKGRAAIFAGCGLHKPGCKECWAHEITAGVLPILHLRAAGRLRSDRPRFETRLRYRCPVVRDGP